MCSGSLWSQSPRSGRGSAGSGVLLGNTLELRGEGERRSELGLRRRATLEETWMVQVDLVVQVVPGQTSNHFHVGTPEELNPQLVFSSQFQMCEFNREEMKRRPRGVSSL